MYLPQASPIGGFSLAGVNLGTCQSQAQLDGCSEGYVCLFADVFDRSLRTSRYLVQLEMQKFAYGGEKSFAEALK